MNCVICGIRKARRACPGVRGDICSICCGTEREQSIDCPLECEYLREAHEHERVPGVPDEDMPDRGVVLEEGFISKYEWLLTFVGSAIIDAYRAQPAITDFDVREALAALVKTYQTLDSGLLYETKPSNPHAAAISEAVQARIAAIRQRLAAEGQSGYITDAAILKLLVFLRRLEYLDNNGRRRSRSVLDMLNRSYLGPPKTGAAQISEPDAPRIIL